MAAPHYDAIRILYVLVAGSSPLPAGNPSEAVAIFKGEKRVQAFDFWMRNPDYLAAELLDLFDASGESRFLRAAERIFATDEPDIRRYPMVRFKFGAFEWLDNTLAVLVSRSLVRITGHKVGGSIQETDFLLMQKAFDLAVSIVTDYPALAWYSERAALVAEVAGSDGGTALKKRQYREIEYAETNLGGTIPPITSRVRSRLESINARQ